MRQQDAQPSASSDERSLTPPPVIGVDIGGGKIAVGAVAHDGGVIVSRQHPTRAERGPEAIVAELVLRIREISVEIPHAPSRVGLGVCGQVDVRDGVVRGSPNLPGWTNFPLRERLETALRLPVVIANDVNVIALGEWRYGLRRGVDDLVVVFVGTGVGAGVISQGRMLVGHRGYAAEVGHATVEAGGRQCTCGNRGCLEAYVGGWALGERAREAVARDPPAGARLVELAGSPERIRSETVAAANAEGDGLARSLVDETGYYFGAGMVGVINSFNPGRIVLGGGVLEGIPELLDRVSGHVRRYALRAATEELEIVPARFGPDAGVIGAAVLAGQTQTGDAAAELAAEAAGADLGPEGMRHEPSTTDHSSGDRRRRRE